MKQVILIGGGEIFRNRNDFRNALQTWEYHPFDENKRWRFDLGEKLKNTHQYSIPDMPNKFFASYEERKIWFEKLFPYLNDEGTILIGHSLGTIFLLKYLVENEFPVKLGQLHLVASFLDLADMPPEYDYLGDFVFNVSNIPTIEKKVDQIYIYHSKDDKACPYSHAERLVAYLPKANFLNFEDRGHFNQSEFPELLENILK